MHPHLFARLNFISNVFSTSLAVDPRSPPFESMSVDQELAIGEDLQSCWHSPHVIVKRGFLNISAIPSRVC